MDFHVGAAINDRYEATRIIARGGICVVGAAEHRYTGRQVAIKLLDPMWREHPGAQGRLLREARLMEMSRHANVVDVIDAGVDEQNQPYLVMELLSGRTLAGLLTTRRLLGEHETVRVGLEIAHALDATHKRGIIHRDIKPSNIMLTHVGEHNGVKLIDFGIATTKTAVMPVGSKLTEPGEIIGTPQYMAPELLRLDSGVTPRADVYSLGVTLYECITGEVPHTGSFGTVLFKIMTEQTPAPAEVRPGLSPGLSQVIMKALSHDPGDRYADVASFAAALRSVRDELGGREEVPFEAPGQQRRRFERQPYITEVRLSFEEGAVVEARSEDISLGGMLIVTQKPCEQSGQGLVEFALPLSGRPVSLPTRARWVTRGHEKTAVGLEFSTVDEEARMEIERYVAILGGKTTQYGPFA